MSNELLDPMTVGQINSPYQLVLENRSSVAAGAVNVDSNSIFLTPSCGDTTSGAEPPCPAGELDPGVFSFSLTGVGTAGHPSCVGTIFDIRPDRRSGGSRAVHFRVRR